MGSHPLGSRPGAVKNTICGESPTKQQMSRKTMPRHAKMGCGEYTVSNAVSVVRSNMPFRPWTASTTLCSTSSICGVSPLPARTDSMNPFTGTPSSWNELIASLPLAHLLQTWEWSQVKTKYGWQAMPFVWQDEKGKPCRGCDGFEAQPAGRLGLQKKCACCTSRKVRLWTGRMPLCASECWTICAPSQNARAPSLSKLTRMWCWGPAFPGQRRRSSSMAGKSVRSELEPAGGDFRRTRSSSAIPS